VNRPSRPALVAQQPAETEPPRGGQPDPPWLQGRRAIAECPKERGCHAGRRRGGRDDRSARRQSAAQVERGRDDQEIPRGDGLIAPLGRDQVCDVRKPRGEREGSRHTPEDRRISSCHGAHESSGSALPRRAGVSWPHPLCRGEGDDVEQCAFDFVDPIVRRLRKWKDVVGLPILDYQLSTASPGPPTHALTDPSPPRRHRALVNVT